MGQARQHSAFWWALVWGLAGCAHPFHRAYEEELREQDVSALTAVSAHYLAPGESVALGEFRFLAGEDRVDIRGPDGPVVRDPVTPVRLRDGTLAVISRQAHDWRVLVHDPSAPARANFRGLVWFPHRRRYVVLARYERSDSRRPREVLTSRGESKILYEAGVFVFELGGAEHRLVAFGYEPEAQDDEPLLIPFKDRTSGTSTYGAGRYLERPAPPGSQTLLDFNRAHNPLCAYSPHYNCPFPPAENRLNVAILAGERTGPGH